jgi:hypothetical protein
MNYADPVAPPEQIFQRLQNRAEIAALIGKTEDLYLDCKTWPSKDDECQKILAKALSGFANADGGVIVVGMEAKPVQKFDPDLISSERPVADATAVKARIEALVGEMVEPPLRGVRVAAVAEQPGSKAGFVLIHVPPTDGFPVRSRKNSHFYQRIASGTYQMEYFQIADMFGRRRRPSLELCLEEIEMRSRGLGNVVVVERLMMLGLRNKGRGIARFPSIRLQAGPLSVHDYGGNSVFGLDRLPAEPGVIAFGGGVNHVIHAGTILRITKLVQSARISNCQRPGATTKVYIADKVNAAVEMFADGVEAKTETITLPEAELEL